MNFTALKDLIEGAGYETRSYVGRGMQSPCVGVVVKGELGEFVASYMEVAGDLIDADGSLEEFSDAAAALRYMKMDSMGRDTILYFPRVKWEGRDLRGWNDDEA